MTDLQSTLKSAPMSPSLLERGRRWLEIAVLVGGLVSLAESAHAQCTAGTPVGSCPAGIGFEGCCSDAMTVAWCEGGSLCELDCSANLNAPTNSCCVESPAPGCCDAAIMDCVCGLDPYCCDADPFISGGVWDYFCAQYAVTDCGGCGAGCPGPATSCGWMPTEGFYDCQPSASSDPSGTHPASCSGGGCVAQCSGKSCGPDGCGGVCGQCPAGQSCNLAGQCQAGGCVPQCAGRSCGSDGCGGVCGQCLAGQTCDVNGLCQSSGCVPQCAGRECGSNGCGGVCGQCLSSENCVSGQCVSSQCTPSCAGRACGDDGCGGSCGSCSEGAVCSAGQCVGGCVPACVDKECGEDGCGGSCGSCVEGEVCRQGACESACSCSGRTCGDDGCGRTCGFCGPNTVCNSSTYQCDPVNVTQGPDVTSEPGTCPAGQIWSQYAASCVVDPNATSVARSGDDCAGGGASGGVLGVGLLALMGLRRRRAVTAR